MNLTKRLGFSTDLLNQVAEVLEGKKITHPNQRAISAAAPPADEITSADFKALKSRKKFRVEGTDRNKKRYVSPIFESHEDAENFYNKLRKSAPLSALEIIEIEEYFPSTDTTPAVQESKEVNTQNADSAREHDCAKHVVHEHWGIGETIATMHAAPDSDGNIAWYDVMFEHGIEQEVPTSELEIIVSESHKHSFVKRKKMSEAMDSELHNKKKREVKNSKNSQIVLNPDTGSMSNEEVEIEEATKSATYNALMADPLKNRLERLKQKEKSMAPGISAERKKLAIEKDKIQKQLANKQRNEEVELDEISIQTVNSYLDQTDGDEKREKGRALALKKKWGGRVKGTEAPKVPVKEEDALSEGRKAGTVALVLNNPKAKEHFTKLTGKEASYYHITKNPEHAQAALDHASRGSKSSEGENDSGSEDTEANKHPIAQLRSIMDKNGGQFMGKTITRGHAAKLVAHHDSLKPLQKADFVSNIGTHLKKVMSS